VSTTTSWLHLFYPSREHLRIAADGTARRQRCFHGNRAGDCFDDRRKRKQQSITHGLDDLPIVRGNKRINQLRAVRFRRQQRAFLVRAHEARIAHHVEATMAAR